MVEPYLKPPLSLRPLTANIDELEWDAFDVHLELVDALGGLPAVQDVLLRGHIIGSGQAVQVVVEIANRLRYLLSKRIFQTPRRCINLMTKLNAHTYIKT